MKISSSRGEYEVRFCSLREAIDSVRDAVFITDENVASCYRAALENHETIVLPAGETTKSIAWFSFCLEELAKKCANRSSTIAAFGGGVVGDLAGFVASAYMRGIRYFQIPSSLIAQVDSAIGGKVGVDLAEGKNLAGAFYPPVEVLVCTDLLQTLDQRQFINGMAEVWKYAFTSEILHDLSQPVLSATDPRLGGIIRSCVEAKGSIVSEDEFETLGIRAVLNYGHTIGHALEKTTGYTKYLHGEAISIGMVAEAKLGEALGLTKAGTEKRVREALSEQSLPVDLPEDLDAHSMMQSMSRDKKRRGNGLAFSLLTELGGCKLVEGLPESEVEWVLFH